MLRGGGLPISDSSESVNAPTDSSNNSNASLTKDAIERLVISGNQRDFIDQYSKEELAKRHTTESKRDDKAGNELDKEAREG